MHKDDVTKVMDAFRRAIRGERVLVEFRLRTRSGKYVEVESMEKPLVDGGTLIGTMTVTRDISARKEAEREKQRRYELERSNEELERFASICSHDLQEPLRMISSFAALLKEEHQEKFDAEAKQYMNYIISGAKRMSELVKDVLQYSKLGAPAARFNQVNCETVLKEAIANLTMGIEESHAEISAGPLPTITGNSSQMVRLFQNLISNSIKYRGERSPSIRITAEEVGEEWQFRVEDNGIGFDMKFANDIFDVFRRLHGKDTYPGSGLGLASCKKIVERHMGRIWVKSEVGKGSSFYFTIPVKLLEVSESSSTVSFEDLKKTVYSQEIQAGNGSVH